MVGPFIFVDEFGPARLPAGQGMDVRPHPHINLATVTYLFDGAIEHRDSIGSHAVIEPGAINLMTAGSGIVHSERSPQATSCRRAEPVRDADLAGASRRPRGGRRRPSTMSPKTACPSIEDGACSARVLMGSLWGATAATPQHSPTIYADIELDAGGSIPIDAGGRRTGGHGGRRRGRARWRSARSLHALRAEARPRRAAVERERRASHAARRRGLFDPRATSSGTSSPRRATGSTRRKRIGRRGASR